MTRILNLALRSGIAILAAAHVPAQVELRPPSFGCHVTAGEGILRTLHGVRNSVSATRSERGVVAAACAGDRALYQTDTEIILDTGAEHITRPHSETSDGPVLLAVDEKTAIVVRTTTGIVEQRTEGDWHELPLRLPVGVRAIRLAAGRLSTLAGDRLDEWGLASGALLSSHTVHVPEGPAVLLSGGSVLAIADGSWLHCTPTACAELAPAPESIVSLSPLSDDWIAASAAAGLSRAVRLRDGVLESFYLPGEPRE